LAQKGFLLKMGFVFTNFYTVADTELVTDVVVSEGSGNYSDKFVGVYTVNPTELPKGYNSSHMQANLPAEGNILSMGPAHWLAQVQRHEGVAGNGRTNRWNWF